MLTSLRSLGIVLFPALALMSVGLLGRSASAADAGAPAGLPACIAVKTDSRYVPYGYNHIVILTNGCTRPAACTVSTDVNREPQNVNVPAAQSVEVTTFMGSPSSSFTAKVGCSLR